jgi:hypothetical protein
MRADLAPFVVDLLLGFAGLGVLVAFRIVPVRPMSMVAAFGLAYLTGAALVPLAMTVLVIIGIPFDLETYGLVTVICIGVGVWYGRKWARERPPAPPARSAWWRRPWRSWPVEVWIVAVFVLAFGAFSLVGILTAWRVPVIGWDAWGFYARKAEMLTWHDSLIPQFWGNSNYTFVMPGYPLQISIFEALHFRAAGSIDTQEIARHLWLLLVAFVWGAAYILRDRVRPVVWAPVLLLVAVAPGIWEQLLTDFTDVPMAMFAGMGAIALGLWLNEEADEGGGARFLALAAVMLGAAANTKNEGLMVAVALLLVGGAVGLLRHVRIRPFLIASGAVAVSILPWRIWMSAHDVKSDLPVGKGLDPGYMIPRVSRIWPAIRTLSHELSDQSRWVYLLPLAVLVILAALISGTARRVAAFYAASFVVVFAGFVWTYWLSPYPIGWHLENSANRVITVMVFICVAAVVHVSGLLLNELQQKRQHPGGVQGELPSEPADVREPVVSGD